MWYHLSALGPEDTAAYVDFRLEVAGAEEGPVFGPGASEVVYRHSGGVPRVINNLCTNALLLGFGKEERPVSAATVEEAAQEIVP
jgi:general secretion pathway protein A